MNGGRYSLGMRTKGGYSHLRRSRTRALADVVEQKSRGDAPRLAHRRSGHVGTRTVVVIALVGTAGEDIPA